jgi:protein tyrosine phosphatase (PTP) superfamily phosphohydrolase (DUF442 family)
MKHWSVLVLLVALVGCDDGSDGALVADCGSPIACELTAADAAGLDTGVELDAELLADMGPLPDMAEIDAMLPDAAPVEMLTVVERHEHDIGHNWLSAGQPSEARVRQLVGMGAAIISLRYPQEDPFDEPALVAELGGTYTRYPVQASDYEDPDFREALYDIYDAHMEAGGPVYMHCASSNRAGASWALYQAERVGVDPEEALELGRQAGMSSTAALVRGILGL